MNFHTILIIFGLTYELSAPQCQFLFSVVFVFQVFPILKVPQKFRKNYIKNQRPGSFRNHQKREGGDPPGLQASWWRGPRGARQVPSWILGGPPWCPPLP